MDNKMDVQGKANGRGSVPPSASSSSAQRRSEAQGALQAMQRAQAVQPDHRQDQNVWGVQGRGFGLGAADARGGRHGGDGARLCQEAKPRGDGFGRGGWDHQQDPAKAGG